MGLPLIALAVSGAGAAIGTYGALESSQAAAGAAHYNAAVANRNSIIAGQNVAIAMQAGEAQAGMQGQRIKAQVGAIKADQGASGVDVGTGSASQVQLSARELGELDAQTIRSNAVKEAYGLSVQSANFKAEEGLKEFEAKSDITAGEIGAASTFLGSAGSAADKYAQFQITSGKGFTG